MTVRGRLVSCLNLPREASFPRFGDGEIGHRFELISLAFAPVSGKTPG